MKEFSQSLDWINRIKWDYLDLVLANAFPSLYPTWSIVSKIQCKDNKKDLNNMQEDKNYY